MAEATTRRRARSARTTRQVLATRRVLQAIEAERQRQGLSKAELAARIGMVPSALRRLLTSAHSNPSFGTVVALLDGLGLEVAVHRAAAADPAERELALG
jgi:transcriptional regulator with XRE-family HTH domain